MLSRSSVRSLRLASFMIVCQLVCNATLAQPVISSILKILIMVGIFLKAISFYQFCKLFQKTKLETIPETVSMMAIVCQRQKVPEISRKFVVLLSSGKRTMIFQSRSETVAPRRVESDLGANQRPQCQD